MSAHIVILGAGFGGTYTARHLERLLKADHTARITLISRDNYMLVTPLLFEAGSGVLEPRHAVTPLRPLFKRVQFIEGDVTRVDLDARSLVVRPTPGRELSVEFDHLVFALGGVTNTRLIPGSEKAMTFKTLADAIYLRNRTIDLYEQASVELDADRKRAMLSFVIIGAGLVGVELMGELTEFTGHLCKSYPNIKPDELHFELIEASPNIMPEMDRDLAEYAADVLRRRGVNVRTSTPVKAVDDDRVTLPDGSTISASTIVLAAGVATNPLLVDLPLQKDRRGRIQVEATMRSLSRANVWALGDCAAIPDPLGNPYPQLAQHAMREARVLAGNIAASLRGQPLQPFVYKTLGTLAALGHYKGVGRVWKFKIRGFVAWWVWRSYYLFQMPKWNRRFRIMIDWTVALLFKNDIVKLDLFGESHPTHVQAPHAPRDP